MQKEKQTYWSIIKPLLIMSIALIGIIIMLHSATIKTVKTKDCCEGSTKQINADVLNAISVKLM